jgi:hypothetical protein
MPQHTHQHTASDCYCTLLPSLNPLLCHYLYKLMRNAFDAHAPTISSTCIRTSRCAIVAAQSRATLLPVMLTTNHSSSNVPAQEVLLLLTCLTYVLYICSLSLLQTNMIQTYMRTDGLTGWHPPCCQCSPVRTHNSNSSRAATSESAGTRLAGTVFVVPAYRA